MAEEWYVVRSKTGPPLYWKRPAGRGDNIGPRDEAKAILGLVTLSFSKYSVQPAGVELPPKLIKAGTTPGIHPFDYFISASL